MKSLTVKELISELKKFKENQDSEVFVVSQDNQTHLYGVTHVFNLQVVNGNKSYIALIPHGDLIKL